MSWISLCPGVQKKRRRNFQELFHSLLALALPWLVLMVLTSKGIIIMNLKTHDRAFGARSFSASTTSTSIFWFFYSSGSCIRSILSSRKSWCITNLFHFHFYFPKAAAISSGQLFLHRQAGQWLTFSFSLARLAVDGLLILNPRNQKTNSRRRGRHWHKDCLETGG